MELMRPSTSHSTRVDLVARWRGRTTVDGLGLDLRGARRPRARPALAPASARVFRRSTSTPSCRRRGTWTSEAARVLAPRLSPVVDGDIDHPLAHVASASAELIARASDDFSPRTRPWRRCRPRSRRCAMIRAAIRTRGEGVVRAAASMSARPSIRCGSSDAGAAEVGPSERWRLGVVNDRGIALVRDGGDHRQRPQREAGRQCRSSTT